MRRKRDVAGAWVVHTRRRRSRALLAKLELPAPFDLATFIEQVARRRGRPIQLVTVQGAAAHGWLRGWWCSTRDLDLIFLDEATSGMHREHIVLHEIGHVLWGHEPVLATSAAEVERATSHLPWDSAAITAMPRHPGYDSPREQDAEVFATVAGLKIAALREACR